MDDAVSVLLGALRLPGLVEPVALAWVLGRFLWMEW
jgi:hypothetical protein